MAISLISETPKQILWSDPTMLADCHSQHFDAQYWQQNNSIIGSASGRGTTYFVDLGQHQGVLRHYRRGGLIGKLIADSYLFTGKHRTRAWQELQLLEKLNELNLPAPKPIAARVTRQGLCYKADILCEKIPHAEDVHHHLLTSKLADEVWFEMGKTIKQFHHAQVYHHDLNIHNIMLDNQTKIWLIDFDKCGFQAGQKWKSANLDRLHRSLNKESGLHPNYHFSSHNWQCLLDGYQR